MVRKPEKTFREALVSLCPEFYLVAVIDLIVECTLLDLSFLAWLHIL